MRTAKVDMLGTGEAFLSRNHDSQRRDRIPFLLTVELLCLQLLGCTPKGAGRTATQRSEKGSEKVLGRVLGKGFSEGF